MGVKTDAHSRQSSDGENLVTARWEHAILADGGIDVSQFNSEEAVLLTFFIRFQSSVDSEVDWRWDV